MLYPIELRLRNGRREKAGNPREVQAIIFAKRSPARPDTSRLALLTSNQPRQPPRQTARRDCPAKAHQRADRDVLGLHAVLAVF